MKISQHSVVITVTIFSMKESQGYWRLYSDVVGEWGVQSQKLNEEKVSVRVLVCGLEERWMWAEVEPGFA